MDPAVAVAAMVRGEDLRDRSLECCLRIWRPAPGLVIKERGAGQARDPQKDREREVSLEGNDGLELQRRP